jgi:hypothetical protein
MNTPPLELTGLGFWLALALVVCFIIWAAVKKQQMKHELTLKLLEKGQTVDTELLAKLIAPASVRIEKSAAERHREAGGMLGFLFILFGLLMAFMGIVSQSRSPWPLLGLGAFTFLLGNWIWYGTMKEYYMRKELEKDLSRN